MQAKRDPVSPETWFVGVLGFVAIAAYLVVFWPFSPSAAASPAEVFGMLPLLVAAVGFALPMGSLQAVAMWRRLLDSNTVWAWLCPLTLWFLYGIGTGIAGHFVPSDVLKLAIYLPAPVALALFSRTWAGWCGRCPTWVKDLPDWLLALSAWIPLQLKWIDLPTVPLPSGHDQIQLDPLLAAAVAFWALLVVRRLPGFNFRLFFTKEDAALGVKLYGVYVLFALPLALGTGFVHWGKAFTLHQTEFQQPFWLVYPLLPIGMYFGVALIEEVLFRGLLQNLVSRALNNVWLGLAVASLVFGIVHNKFGQPTLYVVFAALAGAVYGYAYIRTGRIMAGAVCHALVNSTWLALFNPMAK